MGFTKIFLGALEMEDWCCGIVEDSGGSDCMGRRREPGIQRNDVAGDRVGFAIPSQAICGGSASVGGKIGREEYFERGGFVSHNECVAGASGVHTCAMESASAEKNRRVAEFLHSKRRNFVAA